jgi:hypothetical protein
MSTRLPKGKDKREGGQGLGGTGAREGEPCGLFFKRVAEVAEVTEVAEVAEVNER